MGSYKVHIQKTRISQRVTRSTIQNVSISNWYCLFLTVENREFVLKGYDDYLFNQRSIGTGKTGMYSKRFGMLRSAISRKTTSGESDLISV